jgi:hypothetical protein
MQLLHHFYTAGDFPGAASSAVLPPLLQRQGVGAAGRPSVQDDQQSSDAGGLLAYRPRPSGVHQLAAQAEARGAGGERLALRPSRKYCTQVHTCLECSYSRFDIRILTPRSRI